MDFYRIVKSKPDKEGVVSIFPDYTPNGFTDLMIRGGSFYAIWDEEAQAWSTDEYDVARLVDSDLEKYSQTLESDLDFSIKWMNSFSSRSWLNFKQFLRSISDRYHPMDRRLVFLDEATTKQDYVTKRLPYNLEDVPTPAWDELVGELYSPVERQKIEWAIGSVISGESRTIQKFLVFYGSAGTGKSTILNIIEKLFVGYCSTFEAKALGANNSTFSTSAFKNNPLVAIQHDGDLSRIEDNTKLNSIVAHEDILINEKFQSIFSMKIDSFLFMGTNKPVRITDSRSGLVRRVIDVHPTGNQIRTDHYNNLVKQIDFELGGIANRCLNVFRSLGKNYYNAYRPVEMMAQTDYFYNFVAASYDVFLEQGGISRAQAWAMFKEFCEEQKIDSKMPQFKFVEELKNYFANYEQRAKVGDVWVWGWYSGFDVKRFIQHDVEDEKPAEFEMLEDISILDEVLESLPAQYSRVDSYGNEIPEKRWDRVKTTLSDINTKELHYVRIPPNHIVIDFDLKDDSGEKSLDLNLEEAAKWPKTYGELSKSGSGVHLHYMYDGDTELLRPVYSDGVEVKVFKGNSSLRRKLSRCNNTPIATLSGGLPLKEKKMLDEHTIHNEKQLRALIAKALRKDIGPGTKSNVDFIEHVLAEAYRENLKYNVTDMKAEIIRFALGSTHQSERSLDAVSRMHFKSDHEPEDISAQQTPDYAPKELVFFDIECYSNLFLIVYKVEGDNPLVVMTNPSADEVAKLFKMRLVGFNCRKYDNHMLYAASLGYDMKSLYELSQRLISNGKNSTFAAAYNLSYTDVFDYASEKMTLKKWQVKLGIPHVEMDIPWDQPVPDNRMLDVVDYCKNDVVSLEKVHNARKGDFKARLILSELSGLTPNHTTNSHSAAIIFGKNKRPQGDFKYTNLSTMFPGYVFDSGKSYYKDELVGEGGYVYAEEGIYENVVLLDVTSMHPTSIEELELFGPKYTQRFSDLKNARVAIKNSNFEEARRLLDGKLAPFLEDTSDSKMLSDALKIVINSVYGLTSATFDNPFRHPRNKDNIVAKRGALFMIDLKLFVQQELKLQVVHIKTDSIKVVNPSKTDIIKINEFGKKYGYNFEHEATYDKFCLFNQAVYVARENGVWSPKGKQFLDPYVFKMLFSKEELEFEDYFESRSVNKGSIYLDFGYNQRDGFAIDDNARFMGRTGVFVPVRENTGGGILYRVFEDKTFSIPDTKGYLWKDSTVATFDEIDTTYFDKKVDKALKAIESMGSYEELIN